VQEQLSDRTWWKLTKFATRFVWETELEPGQVFLFGSESNGLPPRILEESPDSNLKLPMYEQVRSLNLASTATAVMYEAVRQFGGLP
jgi:tRNA (cytidine/uridine-2'-O-)-methyltransferase